ANGDGVEGRDCAKAIEINGQVAALRGGNDHRHNKIAGARTAFGSIGGSGSGRVGSLAGIARVVVKPSAHGDHADDQNPEPQVALGRSGSRTASAWLGKVHGINLTHSSLLFEYRGHGCASESAQGRTIATRL